MAGYSVASTLPDRDCIANSQQIFNGSSQISHFEPEKKDQKIEVKKIRRPRTALENKKISSRTKQKSKKSRAKQKCKSRDYADLYHSMDIKSNHGDSAGIVSGESVIEVSSCSETQPKADHYRNDNKYSTMQQIN